MDDRDIKFDIAILHFQNFRDVCHFQKWLPKHGNKKWAVKIQHCPISSKFDMWVDNDVPN
jgi:hypothetical protein